MITWKQWNRKTTLAVLKRFDAANMFTGNLVQHDLSEKGLFTLYISISNRHNLSLKVVLLFQSCLVIIVYLKQKTKINLEIVKNFNFYVVFTVSYFEG